MINDRTKFRPVYGTEAQIDDVDFHEGWLYIASDTGKIQLDADGERKIVGGIGGSGGGSSSIFWAFGDEDESTIRKETDDTSDGDPYYYIHRSAIEGDVAPMKDALIINSDGRFFKVCTGSMTQDKFFRVELIAVSGGGSGGGGGGGSTTVDLSLQWDNIELLNSVYIYGKSSIIRFFPKSEVDDFCYVFITVTDKAGESPTIEDSTTVYNNEPFEFDTAQLPLSNNLEIAVTVKSDSSTYNRGKGLTKTFQNIKTVEMGISKVSSAYQEAITPDSIGGLTLQYVPTGPTSSEFTSFTETLHVAIDGDEDYDKQVTLNRNDFGQAKDINIGNQQHGVHKITMWVSTTINRNEIASDPIEFQAAWVEQGNEMPLIWFGDFDHTVINYENCSIPYMIYNPADVNNGNHSSRILLFKDGEQVSEIDVKYSATNWLYWDVSDLYTVTEGKVNTINNFTIQCGVVSETEQITVTTEGSRQLDIRPANYLIMNFSAAGRSNSELKSNRVKWINKAPNPSPAEAILSDFNWANNGWVSPEPGSEDYNSGAYLTIANGSSVTIPMGNFMVNNRDDYSFEFRFRVRNVQQYSTLVTSTAKYYYEQYDSETDTWTAVKTDSKTMKEITTDPNLRVLYNEWGSPWDDEENVANEINISKGVICSWLSDEENKYGFVIGTQEAFFNSSKKLVRVRYKDDQILNLSFVISKTDHTVYIYLNGIPAGAAPLPVDSNNNPVGWYINNKNLVFNSEYCDLDLFRVRMFKYSLSTPQVIHNYLADKHDIKLYDQNQLTKVGHDNLLDYDLLVQYNENNPDSLTMPYATWEITDGDNEILPYKKGNNRICTITFVNPSADKLLDDGEITAWQYYTHTPSYMATGVDINVQGTSSQEYPRRNYKTKFKQDKVNKDLTLWEFTHGPLAGQSIYKDHYFNTNGTWVGKNVEKQGDDEDDATYKSRMAQYKKLGKKFHVDAESVSTAKFTWKIDYMESSGTYNTGFANLMGNLQAPLYNKHPLEDLGLSAIDMRTSVYGFPVLTFHKFKNNTYEYIGRYNMNLDKSSNEYYGFEVDKAHPYLPGKTVAEVAECWEMKDNQGSWCSLKFPNQAARENGFDTRRGESGVEETKLEMTRHYEVRYNPNADPIEAILGETLGYNDSVEEKYLETVGPNRTAHNHYLRQRFYQLERLLYWLDSTDTTNASSNPIVDYEPILNEETGDVTIQVTPRESVSFLTAKSYDGINGATSQAVTGGFLTVFTQDSVEYRLEKFKQQLQDHLDLHYCLVYFILTELLLCFDSRGKNMMLATFGPHAINGEYIWYPIFYDIDTQLGLNNSGSYLWDYDEECTENGTFSTATSVLWNNLWETYQGDIITEYAILRGQSSDDKNHGNFTYQNIVGAYECNPTVFGSYAMMGVRPIIAIGLDEYYKYFATTTASGIGYYTTSGVLTFEATPTYAYCCQGDKLLTTELLLRNRLNYVDSKWLAGDYSEAALASSSITARSTLNNPATSDTFLNLPQEQILNENFTHGDYPVPYFDAVPGFKIKPFLKQYVSYYTDQVSSVPVKFSDSSTEQEGVWTNVNSDMLEAYQNKVGLNDQIFKIPGADYISSLGDLSTTYLTRFLVNGGRRLLDLKIGSDVPGYKHTAYDPAQVNFYAASNDSNNKPLLRQVILSQISSLTGGLNFSGSSKLNEFRALGTGLTEIVFAAGAPLRIVHLPKTIGNFEIQRASDLTKLLTSKPVVGTYENGVFTYNDPSTYEGLYIEGVTDLDLNAIPRDNGGNPIGHAITRLNIIGGNLKYNSYILLRNLIALKDGAAAANQLGVNLEDVEWTPYTAVEYGEPQGAGPYYKLTEHGTYELYTGVLQDEWQSLTLNQKVFTKDESLNTSIITSLDLLDTFRREYDNTPAGNINNFTNLAGLVQKTYPYISGEMYIDNTPETAVNESDLTDIYGVIWPDLIIRAHYINEAYLAKYVQVLDNGKENEIDIIRYTKGANVHPTITSKTAAKQNYDFRGWSLNKNHAIMTVEDFMVANGNGDIYHDNEDLQRLTFDNSNDVFVLYAVFTITAYNINFKNYKNGIETTLYVDKVDCGKPLKEPPILPTTDETDLGAEERYKFLGWVINPEDCFPKTERIARVIDITSIISQNVDRTFYACYFPESVYDSTTDENYFNFTDTTYTDPTTGVITSGYSISVKDGVSLRGKITLPTTHNNIPIIRITGFQGAAATSGDQTTTKGGMITHVYWLGDSNLLDIDNEAFRGCINLRYFDMPRTVKRIGSQAFLLCYLLEWIDFSDTALVEIGISAFQQSLTTWKTDTLNLIFPPTLQTIGARAFYNFGAEDSDILNRLSVKPNGIFIKDSSDAIVGSRLGTLEFGHNEAGSKLSPVNGLDGTICFYASGHNHFFTDVKLYCSPGTDANLYWDGAGSGIFSNIVGAMQEANIDPYSHIQIIQASGG